MFVLLLTLALALHQLQAATYLDVHRDTRQSSSDRNLLRLTCLNTANGLRFIHAIFFLNDTIFFDLLNPDDVESEERGVDVFHHNGEIVFTINPQVEGDYSCGVLALDGRSFFFSSPIRIVGEFYILFGYWQGGAIPWVR